MHSQTRPSFMGAQTGQQIIQSGNYKPYTQKDFNRIQQTQPKQTLGGLGPNIGSEEWEKARTKQKLIQEFSQNIKSYNQQVVDTKQKSLEPRPPKPKEKTAREKAMEFAKHNVPKPKVKPQAQKEESTTQEVDHDADHLFSGIQKNGAKTDKGSEAQEFLAMLDQRHQAYSDEVQKIKKTFGFNI